MHKKVIFLLVLGALVFAGCASLNGNVPFQYQPSLVSADKKIDKTVGLNMLKDKRPEADIKNTASIKDLSEKVTSKLLEDLEKSEIFKDLHIKGRAEDDLIINGRIDRFMWKATPNPIGFIPILNLLQFFGLPTYSIQGITGITLQIKDNKTGKIIGTFTELSEANNTYNIYNFKAGDAGAELAEAFRETSKKLKEDIIKKIDSESKSETE